MSLQFQSTLGMAILLLLCWLTGARNKRVPLRIVAGGICLQFIIALVLLRIPQSQSFFLALNNLMAILEDGTRAGTAVVFGYLGGGPAPFDVSNPGNGYVLAFQALPLVLVISALSSLLFYWRVLPAVVKAFAWVLNRVLGIGGPLGVGATANIFLGMVEAPLLVRPYLLSLHRGELFALMVCGMATVAGTVLVLYAAILAPVIPNSLGQLLTASFISAPAALAMAALFQPWPEKVSPLPVLDQDSDSAMDAVTQGTLRGIGLLLNITAMLIVLIALVSIANLLLQWLPDVGGLPLTLQRVLGWLFAPLAWLMGIPWNEAVVSGQLLGTKLVLNELVAYMDLAALDPSLLSDRSRLLLSYALCGFANLGSLGIMIGGMGALVPERRREIVALGTASVWVGFLTCLATAATVGILV